MWARNKLAALAKMGRWVGLVILLAGMVGLSGCRGETGGGITLAGSTSVEPFAELLAEEYKLLNPKSAPINVQGGGSGAGIQAALMGVADIGMSSRALKPEEAKELTGILIARDAIAVIVNPRSPLADIPAERLRDIFAGRVRDWQELGWEARPITVVTREEGSGTRDAFGSLVMGKDDVAASAIVQDSNGAVRAIVAQDPHAIGYISLGLVNQEVKALRVDGIEASAESVTQGKYRLARPFLFLTKGEPKGEVTAFIEFVLSPEAQALLASEGLVRAKE